MKNWHLIIALPKTGSSWLGNMLNISTDHNYFREFFNPWTWRGKHNFKEGIKNLIIENEQINNNNSFLPLAFGLQGQTDNIRFLACPWEENPNIQQVFDSVWAFDENDKIINKEVWSFCNIGFFVKYFNITILHRKPDLIFNGYKENSDTYKFYLSIYNSFLLNKDKHNQYIKNLLDIKTNDVEKKCLLAHKMATFYIFEEAKKYNLPVIDYETLLTCNDTYSYLSDKISNKILTNELIQNIDFSKFKNNFITKRKEEHYYTLSKKIKLI